MKLEKEETTMMTELSVYCGYGEELERRLRLKTFPVAVKLLEQKSDKEQKS